jgi:hypothetical protein
MRKLISIALLAASLGGCATVTKIENAVGVVAQTKVNSKSAYVAINVFNAAERSVTAYLRLPECNGAGTLCRANGAAAALDGPFSAGIQARNDLRAFMKAHPGTLADAGLYNTLTAATDSLQKVMAIYGVGGSK